MFFIPYTKLLIKTELTIDEVCNILIENTYCENLHSFNEKAFFKGKINFSDFKLKRKINHRNSFNPLIVGKIYDNKNYRTIEIKLFTEPIIIVFTLIIQVYLLSLLIISLKEQLNSSVQDFDKIFFIIILILGSYILTMFAFNIEAISIKKELVRSLSKPLKPRDEQ